MWRRRDFQLPELSVLPVHVLASPHASFVVQVMLQQRAYKNKKMLENKFRVAAHRWKCRVLPWEYLLQSWVQTRCLSWLLVVPHRRRRQQWRTLVTDSGAVGQLGPNLLICNVSGSIIRIRIVADQRRQRVFVRIHFAVLSRSFPQFFALAMKSLSGYQTLRITN